MRKWLECISPKQANDYLNCYHGIWMKEMDRCWMSDDNYQVTSRILFTEWGKVEHVCIDYHPEGFNTDSSIEEKLNKMTSDGTRDIPWPGR